MTDANRPAKAIAILALLALAGCMKPHPVQHKTVLEVHSCIRASCRVVATDGARVTVIEATAPGDVIWKRHDDSYWRVRDEQ